MSVFFQLMKGEFDDCMEWPFNKIITIVLIHPDEKSKFHTLLIDEAQKKKKKEQSLECFGKPDTDVNKG